MNRQSSINRQPSLRVVWSLVRPIGLGFFFLLAACNKELTKYPLSGPSDASYFASQDELMLAVSGCYKIINYLPLDNLPTNLELDASSDIGFDRNTSDLQKLSLGNQDANNSFTQGIWSNAYAAIARCNFILDNAAKAKAVSTPDIYTRSMAEVTFIRAYVYQYMVALFGAVPLVTHQLTIATAQIPRTSVDSVYDFIYSQLDSAAAGLPATYGAGDMGRASKGAALAIKARAALYAGNWTVAAQAAQTVMNLGVYSLDTGFAHLFSYAGENSPEILLALQYQLPAYSWGGPSPFLSRNATGTSNKVPSESLVDAYECTDGQTIDQSSLYNPQSPFAHRDPRLGYTIAVPGSVFYNYQFETNKDSLQCWNYNTTPATRIGNQDATNAYATFTGFCWRKYVDLQDKTNVNQSTLHIILIRYAEVLLTYAEARIEANQIDQSVYDAINLVRQRAGVNMPPVPSGQAQAGLRSAVRKERLYELAGEGFRLYDIRRWKIAEQVMNGPFYGRIPTAYLAAAPVIDANGTPDYSQVPNKGDMRIVQQRTFNAQRDYLWPIPYIETQTDPLLTQNPLY
jgi:hypothetical protein